MKNQDILNSTRQEQGHGNFRSKEGKLFLVRCYVCDPEYGRENYAMAIAGGECAWCGWSDKSKQTEENDHE